MHERKPSHQIDRELPFCFLRFCLRTPFEQDRVKTANGTVEGTPDKNADVRSFKAIPFAAPPVGDLRWKPPQPVKDWTGVRKADQFGPRCIAAGRLFGDMGFRSNGMSEDLSLSERLDAGKTWSAIAADAAAGAGLFLRRRIRCR
jgi:hypothetical protein